MGGLKWLDEYSGQTAEELIGLEGRYRTDFLILAFEQALYRKADRKGIEGLSEEERVVLSVEALEREVNNGGYHQFFFNSKEFALIVVDALDRIGCVETAKLTQNAIDSLGMDEVTEEEIENALADENDERDRKLNDCDNRYYETAGDLSEPLLVFIKNNRNKINLG